MLSPGLITLLSSSADAEREGENNNAAHTQASPNINRFMPSYTPASTGSAGTAILATGCGCVAAMRL